MRAPAIATAFSFCLLLGCSAEEQRPMGSRAATGGAGVSSQSVEPPVLVMSASGAGHGPLPDPSAGTQQDEDASTADQCATAEYEAKLRPLDLLVLLDQSGSMTENDDRWTPTTNAIKSFVSSPESAGIGIGLQYFPLGQDDDEKCEGTTYADPSVPIAPLPGNAQAMIESIDAHYFTKENCCDAPEHQGTPTRPALEGVFQYLRDWLALHPERNAVALLATDGEPSECDSNDIEDVSRVMSEAAAATPSLESYVIGIGDQEELDELADAGGTGQGAFTVDGTGGMTEKQLLETLNKIRGESFRCDFDTPSGMYADPNLTNVETSSAAKPRSKLVKVQKPEDCARATQGGWYHDAATKRLQLCPEVCRSIRTEPGVKVNIVVGCAAILL
jgi:hypothetical protein